VGRPALQAARFYHSSIHCPSGAGRPVVDRLRQQQRTHSLRYLAVDSRR